jgi:osmotically-inducible protein OsmY
VTIQQLRLPMPAAVAVGPVLALALALSACSMVSHRTPAQREADRQLAAEVSAALSADAHIYARHIDVRADSGTVHLGGYVWSDRDLFEAKQIAAGVPGVKDVVDELELERGGTDNSPVSR